LLDASARPVVGQELPEGVGRGREAGGHPHALGQLRDHFAEAGVLAADRLDVGHPQVLKRYDQGGRVEKCRHGEAPEVETGLHAGGTARWSLLWVRRRHGKNGGGKRIPDNGRIVGVARSPAPQDKAARATPCTTRTVFFISDGTGITAETFGNAILAQFEIKPRHVRLPFTDTVDKAHQVVRPGQPHGRTRRRAAHRLHHAGERGVLQVIEDRLQGMLLDMFGTFVRPLEIELGMKSNHRIGRFSDVSKSKEYHDRIEAINFSLAHDDGQSNRDLQQADVILVGVSRSGKTPTSLYLAMQHGLKAANYPLIPEDFDRRQLPPALMPHRKKIFGLTIQPERLSEIRNERRPDSRYASAGELPHEVSRGRGDDAARRHPLALDHHQVDRGDRDDDPARAAAGAAERTEQSIKKGYLIG
jgi:regulator of PEP synthase PpsR (kinase-PPPase family)